MRQLRRHRIVVVLLAAASLTTGCDPAQPDENLPAVTDADAQDRSRNFYAEVTVHATGDATFTWTGEDLVMLDRLGAPDTAVNLLSMGVRYPLHVPPDGRDRFRWAFDYLGDYRDEPGRYTITTTPATGATMPSTVLLVWMRVTDPTLDAVTSKDQLLTYQEFRHVRQPCTLLIGRDEATGELDCPAIATDNGDTTHLRVRWQQTRPAPDDLDQLQE